MNVFGYLPISLSNNYHPTFSKSWCCFNISLLLTLTCLVLSAFPQINIFSMWHLTVAYVFFYVLFISNLVLCVSGSLTKMVNNFTMFDRKTVFHPEIKIEMILSLSVTIVSTAVMVAFLVVWSDYFTIAYTVCVICYHLAVSANLLFLTYLVVSVKSRVRIFNEYLTKLERNRTRPEDFYLADGGIYLLIFSSFKLKNSFIRSNKFITIPYLITISKSNIGCPNIPTSPSPNFWKHLACINWSTF